MTKSPKFTCIVCGKEEDSARWIRECGDELFHTQQCFKCNFWTDYIEREEANNPNVVRVDDSHYVINPKETQ